MGPAILDWHLNRLLFPRSFERSPRTGVVAMQGAAMDVKEDGGHDTRSNR